MEKVKMENGVVHNGFTFERFFAEKIGGQWVGGGCVMNPVPGEHLCDVVGADGTRYECKFFTRKYNATKHATMYNHANGVKVRNPMHLLKDIADYCQTFDYLVVGTGDFNNSDTADYEIIAAKDAVQWLAARIMAKCYRKNDKIIHDTRVAYEDEPKAGGSAAKREATLAKWGMALI